MDSQNEGKFGHRIISAKKILTTEKENIKKLLDDIAKHYDVSVEDAAVAMTNVLRNITSGDI